jgi:hypothetical protein
LISTLTLAYSRGGESIAKSVALTTEGEQNVDVVVPGSTSDVQVQMNLTVARLALVFITSDQTVTLETNSSSAPAEALTVTADKPLIWYTGCGWVNPFATNVTAIYLSRGSAGDATVNLRFAYDATP